MGLFNVYSLFYCGKGTEMPENSRVMMDFECPEKKKEIY
jgi:hypothetical protein